MGYASVTEVPQAGMLDQSGPGLVVIAITEDQDWLEDFLVFPYIDRLNIGSTPPNHIQWDQTQEGNLFEFLCRCRSLGLPQEV